ncbi:MAG: GTPase [Planctomycetaceae bacterium]
MSISLTDTIAAQASPSGSAERGIIRVSGDDVADVVARMFVADDGELNWQRLRRPTRIPGSLQLPAIGTPLPSALMFWPTARSYTGQPMAEFHTIGSPPLLDAVLERLLACGARSAGRGEFTMRAFLAGRIDLVQAEAVLGVIDATDHEELQTALTQLGGGLTSQLAGVRSEILSLLGDLEAGLDFVEEDIEFISATGICDRLQCCRTILYALVEQSNARLPSGHRCRVVLAGLPNAGKSTLFNRLLGSGKAIVSDIAGTTRDFLSGHMTLGHRNVELVDTAGWETTGWETATEIPEAGHCAAERSIMQQAQEHRQQQTKHGDLVVWCAAADLSPADAEINDRLRSQLRQAGIAVLDVVTRADLASVMSSDLAVSVVADRGIAELLEAIQQRLLADRSSRSELLASTAARCRDSLQRSLAAVDAAILAAESRVGDEIIALELRDALHQIGTILGEVYTDDILDHIFSKFCIGK